MKIRLSTLPLDVKRKIPLSIRTLRDEYELEELPASVRALVEGVLEKKSDLQYREAFDILPEISEYGDLRILDRVEMLALTYFRNYFLTTPGDYPFDPYFGRRLKHYLQNRDTDLVKSLIMSEAQVICDIIAADLGLLLEIDDFSINSRVQSNFVEYTITVELRVNDRKKVMNFTITTVG